MKEIIVHLYSSYKDGGTSPAGFKYGTFVSSPAGEYYSLSEENKSDFVRKGFDTGIIKKIKGRYKNKFYFIVKRLNYVYSAKKDVTMNIGFEFSNEEDYKVFAASFEEYEKTDDKSLYKMLADCVITDRENYYGYVIEKNKFDKFMEDISQTKNKIDNSPEKKLEVLASEEESQADEDIEITSKSTVDYSQKIKDLFGFAEMPERSATGNIYIFGVKKNEKKISAANLPALLSNLPKKAAIPAAAVIALIALAMNTYLGIAVIAAMLVLLIKMFKKDKML